MEKGGAEGKGMGRNREGREGGRARGEGGLAPWVQGMIDAPGPHSCKLILIHP